MQFSITITGEKNELADGLAVLKAVMGEQIGAGSVQANIETEKKAVEKKTATETKPAKEPDPEPTEDEEEEDVDDDLDLGLDDNEVDAEDIPSDVDLRAKAKEVTDADATKKTEVKALLKAFGVSNLTAIPDDRRVEFMKRLERL